MTKKLIAALLAVSVLLTACVFALAEDGAGEPTNEITVAFDANGGTGEMQALTPTDGKVTIPECSFEKDLFFFEKWNTVADASGESYEPGDEITVDESVTLYAIWTKSELTWYEVTYDANGGEGVTVDDFNPYLAGNDAQVVYNEFTFGDKEFKEWNTKADGTGTSYQPNETFVINADTVLYAIWEGDEEPVIPVGPSEPSSSVDPSDEESKVTDVPPEETKDVVVPETDTNTNPETGDSVAVTVAMGAAIVAMGAVIVLKKKH